MLITLGNGDKLYCPRSFHLRDYPVFSAMLYLASASARDTAADHRARLLVPTSTSGQRRGRNGAAHGEAVILCGLKLVESMSLLQYWRCSFTDPLGHSG